MALKNAVQLICYPNRMGENLSDLNRFIDRHLSTAIGGVHLLPPFPSNADGGFSPLTHMEVDPQFGSWADIEALAERYDICLDLILNHLSDESPEFLDFVRNGRDSEYAPLFVDVDALGEISPDDLAKIHIRKEKEPFREITFADGTTARVWCTFTEQQIDLDFRAPLTFKLMEDNIAFLCARGVKLFRLDAFGYTTKRIGTNCFLIEPDIWKILDWFNATTAKYGAEALPEVHDHPSFQYAIAQRGAHCYAFALPPLVLHSLLNANSYHLKAWLRMCPHNQITVLDTHDGICIPDVEDILPGPLIESLIQNVSERSADPILRRSAANVRSVGAIYQITCTLYDALRQNDDAYIAARAIQLFSPGIPQVYYVGLLAGQNDLELVESSGEQRDINRHFYSMDEAEAALEQPVVQRLLKLMTLRSKHPAFQGQFELHYSNDSSLEVEWRLEDQYCSALIDLNFNTTTITYSNSAGAKITQRW